MNDVSMIIDQLRSISEQLTDLSMKVLSEAIEEGANARPPQEKSISQARRSIEKAINQLESID